MSSLQTKNPDHIRFLWRTDIHVSEKNPVSRKDNYFATCLAKIRLVGHLCKKYNVDYVLDGGDFFHHKSPQLTTHKGLLRIIEAHKDYPCPIYANVGNHDCTYGKLEFLDKQQPLGVLFSSGIFHRCYDEHELFVEKNDLKVRVVGVPYHGTTYDKTRFSKIKKDDEDFLIITAHLLASKNGGSMFGAEDIMSYKEVFDLCPDASLVAFGHWHKDQGITEIDNKYIINVGSLTRGSLSEDHITRKPCVVIVDVSKEGLSLTRIDLPVKDSSEVFYMEEKENKIKRDEKMKDFAERISSESFMRKEEDFYSVVERYDLEENLKEKILYYWERSLENESKK